MLRICRDCGIEKDITDYNKDGKGYYYQPCKICCFNRNRKWQQNNKEQLKNYQREYVANNRDKHNENNRKRNKRLKEMVMNHYGNKCACCGETEPLFLTVDHVNNDGNKHRKKVHGDKIYGHIIKENYPDTFQILCWNCNLGKHLNGGVCPHKNLEGSTTIPKGSTLQANGSGSAELLE